MIRRPGLLAADLTEKARLEPTAASMTMKMVGAGEATITLAEDAPAVHVHDWVSMYTRKGFAGYYRVTNVAQTFRKQIDVSLLYGIDILSDSVWPEQKKFTGTKAQFLTQLLDKQTQLINGVKPWQLGTCEDTGSIERDINYDRLSTLLEALETEGSSYYFVYDQTTWPWTISYVAKSNAVSSEFRLTRNIRTATITYNDADLCTRLYLSVSSKNENTVTVKKKNPAYIDDETTPTVPALLDEDITVSYTDSAVRIYNNNAAQAVWGIVTKTADIDTHDDIAEQHFASADAWAANYLALRKEPSVQIQIDGDTLREITSSSWDESSIGSLCQVALPDYGHTFREYVVSITYPDLVRDDTHVTVSLANTLPKVSESIATARAEAATAARSSRATARAAADAKEVTNWSQIVKYQGDALDGSGVLTLYESGISMDAQGGVKIYSLEQGLQGLYSGISVNAHEISIESSKISLLINSDNSLNVGSIVGAINAQTGESQWRIQADKIILDGTTTATTLDARLANVDDLFTTQGYSQTIYTGTIYTNNIHITSSNGETTTTKNFSPKSIYIGSTLQEMEFLGNDAHHVSLTIPNAVTGFGTATSDATTGEITIPFYTYDNPSNNWAQGNTINFNIADTVFYQNHVGIASVTPAGWTNDGEGGGYYNLVTASANDGSDDDVSVSLPTISLSAALGTAASGSVQAYGPAVDGTAYPVSTALTLYLQPVGDMIYLTNNNSTPTAGSGGNIVAQIQHQGSQTTVNVDKSAWSSGGITFSTNPASGTGAAVSLAFVIPTNTSNGNAQISVVDSASPGSSSQPLSTGLSKTLTLTCDDNYATLKDGGTTVAQVPNNKSVSPVTVYQPTCGESTVAVADNTIRTTINIMASASNGASNDKNFTLERNTYNSGVHCVNLKEGSTVIGRISTETVYIAGQQAVTPTTASISSSTLNSSTGRREATLTVYYKGPDTAEDSEPLSGVDVTSIYNAGKADGSTKSTYPVTFTVTFDDGHTGTVTADCKDIWNQGAADAPAVTTMYAYQSQGSFVNVRNRATSESSAVVGAITTNTPVTYIRTSSGGGYTYVYISYNNNGGTPGNYWINSNFLRNTNGWYSQYNYLGWYGSGGGGEEPGPDDSISAVTITGLVHQAQYYNGRFPITIAPLYPNSSGGHPTSFNSNVSADFANFGTSADDTASMGTYFSTVYSSYYATNNTQSDMGPSDTECQHKMTVRVDLKNGTSYTRLITFKSKYR